MAERFSIIRYISGKQLLPNVIRSLFGVAFCVVPRRSLGEAPGHQEARCRQPGGRQDGPRKRNNEKCPRTVLRRPETKGAREGNGTQRTGRHPRVGGAGKGDCGPGSREERSCERGKRAISSNTSTQEETTRPRSVSKGSALERAKRINFTHGRSIGQSKVRCRTLR